jgi:hypothetical protein
MVYKNKDKQREANAERQRRYRDKHKPKPEITPFVTDQDFTKLMAQAGPGHVDYEPQCETTKAFIEDRPKAEPKRGLEVKAFDDLPPDVQQTIDIMSIVEGKIDQTIKANRTAIAIHYQHIFPGRY